MPHDEVAKGQLIAQQLPVMNAAIQLAEPEVGVLREAPELDLLHDDEAWTAGEDWLEEPDLNQDSFFGLE